MSQKRSDLVELKYCESCGCLLTRAVGSGLTFCAPCEVKQSEEMFLTPPKRRSGHSARLPKGADLQGCAETDADLDLDACA